MPGVFRPYTLVDVLGVINQQATAPTGNQQIDGVGFVAEADETMASADTAATLVQTASAATWDQGLWGSIGWT